MRAAGESGRQQIWSCCAPRGGCECAYQPIVRTCARGFLAHSRVHELEMAARSKLEFSSHFGLRSQLGVIFGSQFVVWRSVLRLIVGRRGLLSSSVSPRTPAVRTPPPRRRGRTMSV